MKKKAWFSVTDLRKAGRGAVRLSLATSTFLADGQRVSHLVNELVGLIHQFSVGLFWIAIIKTLWGVALTAHSWMIARENFDALCLQLRKGLSRTRKDKLL